MVASLKPGIFITIKISVLGGEVYYGIVCKWTFHITVWQQIKCTEVLNCVSDHFFFFFYGISVSDNDIAHPKDRSSLKELYKIIDNLKYWMVCGMYNRALKL